MGASSIRSLRSVRRMVGRADGKGAAARADAVVSHGRSQDVLRPASGHLTLNETLPVEAFAVSEPE